MHAGCRGAGTASAPPSSVPTHPPPHHPQVSFRRPGVDPDSYFSVLLIHQNRENRTMRARAALPHFESYLPRFLDLVVWGHEHECIPALALGARAAAHRGPHRGPHPAEGEEPPEEPPGASGAGHHAEDNRATYILQPGSTVATSLTPGEAAQKNGSRGGGGGGGGGRREGGVRAAAMSLRL